jgi:hypothetical protein
MGEWAGTLSSSIRGREMCLRRCFQALGLVALSAAACQSQRAAEESRETSGEAPPMQTPPDAPASPAKPGRPADPNVLEAQVDAADPHRVELLDIVRQATVLAMKRSPVASPHATF